MTRLFFAPLAFAFVFAFASLPAFAQSPSGYRSALLIGNANYEGFTLKGVGASLDVVEKALKARGFTVTRHENLKKKDEQRQVVDEFIQSVPTNGVALIYYAGLGAHLERNGWQNLLRSTGEKISNDNDYRNVGLNVNDHILEPLHESSGARIGLVFLDACWESPLVPEGDRVKGGMHEFEVGADAVVVFAAEAGQVLPAPGGNTPSALATSLSTHAARFDESVGDACTAIAKDLGKCWHSEADARGLGPPSALPLVEQPAAARKAGEAYVNSIGMVFHWCPPGSFTMGSEKVDSAATRDRKAVAVTLSKGFWMGECEVTQREYKAVMRKDPAPGFTRHRNAPFYGVTESKKVSEFCKKLTEIERSAGTLPDGWEYACPTEAEWEYACRAGSNAAYCFGDSVAQLGHYGNFADGTLRTVNPDYHWADARSEDGVAEALAPVGSYRPNAWGLRDMHGNVAELVADHLLPELPGGTDPLGKMEKDGRTVIRGGAWCSLPSYCESSFRNSPPSRNKADFIGFRIILKRSGG